MDIKPHLMKDLDIQNHEDYITTMAPRKRSLSFEEQAFQNHTGLLLGKCIYRGDGCVYNLVGYPNRLVKIVPSSLHSIRQNIRILKYLYKSQSPAVVKLHDVGSFKLVIEHEAPLTFTYRKGIHHYYYYVMDKLTLLPRKGRARQVDNIRDALLFDSKLQQDIPKKVKSFINKARQLKYAYTDIHAWNILQDKRGSLKFIDLESFMWGEQ